MIEEAEQICQPALTIEEAEFGPCLSGDRGIHDFLREYWPYWREYLEQTR